MVLMLEEIKILQKLNGKEIMFFFLGQRAQACINIPQNMLIF